MENIARTVKSTPKTKVNGEIVSKGFKANEKFAGRVSLKVSSKSSNTNMKREDRRLQSTQIRRNKREEAMDKKRKLGGISGKSAPFLTCFVALHELIDVNSALAIIESCDEEAFVDKTNPNITYLR